MDHLKQDFLTRRQPTTAIASTWKYQPWSHHYDEQFQNRGDEQKGVAHALLSSHTVHKGSGSSIRSRRHVEKDQVEEASEEISVPTEKVRGQVHLQPPAKQKLTSTAKTGRICASCSIRTGNRTTCCYPIYLNREYFVWRVVRFLCPSPLDMRDRRFMLKRREYKSKSLTERALICFGDWGGKGGYNIVQQTYITLLGITGPTQNDF